MAAKDAVLFGDVQFDDYTQAVKSARREKVDVPVEVREALEKAQAARQRPVWPVRDANHFDTMANVLYSAADDMGASVVAQAIKRYRDAEGNLVTEVLKKDARGEATHLRASIGKKRGKRTNAEKSDEADAAVTAETAAKSA